MQIRDMIKFTVKFSHITTFFLLTHSADLDEEEEEEEMEEDQYEEEEQVEEEHEEIIIEREPLYAKYYILYPDYNKIKTKNNFLQKKMVEYFSKRKVTYYIYNNY